MPDMTFGGGNTYIVFSKGSDRAQEKIDAKIHEDGPCVSLLRSEIMREKNGSAFNLKCVRSERRRMPQWLGTNKLVNCLYVRERLGKKVDGR